MNPAIDRPPLLAVRELTVSFRLGEAALVEAVRGVSFDVPQRATVALVGESGSGKSVTAMSIVRLLPGNALVGADSSVEFDGQNLSGKDFAGRPLVLKP